MSQIATVLMKPRSGMTTAAVVLAKGLRANGDWVCLVVPTDEQAESLREGICPTSSGVSIIAVSNLRQMTHAMGSFVLVFDDALRCADLWRKHGEGELLACLQSRMSPVLPSCTRAWFFQYTV